MERGVGVEGGKEVAPMEGKGTAGQGGAGDTHRVCGNGGRLRAGSDMTTSSTVQHDGTGQSLSHGLDLPSSPAAGGRRKFANNIIYAQASIKLQDKRWLARK